MLSMKMHNNLSTSQFNHQTVVSPHGMCMYVLCVYVIYCYRENQGRYGTQKHMEVATEAHHTEGGHDDGEDEVMITNWTVAWCIYCHLWNSWLLLDHHYIGTRLQEGKEEERRWRHSIVTVLIANAVT